MHPIAGFVGSPEIWTSDDVMSLDREGRIDAGLLLDGVKGRQDADKKGIYRSWVGSKRKTDACVLVNKFKKGGGIGPFACVQCSLRCRKKISDTLSRLYPSSLSSQFQTSSLLLSSILLSQLFFHASNSMDKADLQVMSHPPFDPASDVRITHTVHQGRTRDHHTRGLILNHYLRGPSVGKGQHGTVYKCWDIAQNNVQVVRFFPPLSFSPSATPLTTHYHSSLLSLHHIHPPLLSNVLLP
jgi:hypothetical protein